VLFLVPLIEVLLYISSCSTKESRIAKNNSRIAKNYILVILSKVASPLLLLNLICIPYPSLPLFTKIIAAPTLKFSLYGILINHHTIHWIPLVFIYIKNLKEINHPPSFIA
jgi:hypothetical protein